MEYLKIIYTTVFSAVVLFLLTKLMGNKQISQLNMFDYIFGITVGSIAAEMAANPENNPLYHVLAMTIYALIAYFISVITAKSVKLRRLLSGKPEILFDDGVIMKDNLKKARLDVNDFLTYSRLAGYFDLSQVKTAVLEYNGSVSFLPKSNCRPLTPDDMQIKVAKELLFSSVILDGHIIDDNLKKTGKNKSWLLGELKKAGFSDERYVFLALADKSGKLLLYPENTGKKTNQSIE